MNIFICGAFWSPNPHFDDECISPCHSRPTLMNFDHDEFRGYVELHSIARAIHAWLSVDRTALAGDDHQSHVFSAAPGDERGRCGSHNFNTKLVYIFFGKRSHADRHFANFPRIATHKSIHITYHGLRRTLLLYGKDKRSRARADRHRNGSHNNCDGNGDNVDHGKNGGDGQDINYVDEANSVNEDGKGYSVDEDDEGDSVDENDEGSEDDDEDDDRSSTDSKNDHVHLTSLSFVQRTLPLVFKYESSQRRAIHAWLSVDRTALAGDDHQSHVFSAAPGDERGRCGSHNFNTKLVYIFFGKRSHADRHFANFPRIATHKSIHITYHGLRRTLLLYGKDKRSRARADRHRNGSHNNCDGNGDNVDHGKNGGDGQDINYVDEANSVNEDGKGYSVDEDDEGDSVDENDEGSEDDDEDDDRSSTDSSTSTDSSNEISDDEDFKFDIPITEANKPL
ncbi:unnamed protein product [Trichogramma brassicae]|uniref:Uncharacterized protein n=1 Tax=Trichogramma brassicae TaxID=86971 RepID=A0A6H5ITC9_9HYME|nr:unnamed protein product [Trichogramma brassicae]